MSAVRRVGAAPAECNPTTEIMVTICHADVESSPVFTAAYLFDGRSVPSNQAVFRGGSGIGLKDYAKTFSGYRHIGPSQPA